MDMPDHSDTGVISRAAKNRAANPAVERTAQERIDDSEMVIFIKHIPYQTGVNVIGTGRGDTSDQMDVTVLWPHPQISVEFEIWSPDISQAAGQGDHRMTLTYFVVNSCTYPSAAGTANPDTASNL
eukprot:Sspe_Gene.1202::Locus_405_Transcript_1_3_Confidence_0.714_Length_7052::g.1202::m.1202